FEHLRARAKDFVNGIETESSYPGAWLGPTPTPESPCWSRLNCLVRQSLPAGGDLQRLLELGLAFGRLELAAYQNVGETVPAQPPEEQPPALAGGVLRAVAVVPSRVVGAVPALQTLQRLSAAFDASAPACTFTNAVGIDRIPDWMRDKADAALFEAVRLLVKDIETSLRTSPLSHGGSIVVREEPIRPHWDKRDRTLWYGSTPLKQFA